MKIVVNTSSLLPRWTGIGQYTHQICRALRSADERDDYTYYYGFFSRELPRDGEEGGPGSGEQRRIALYRGMRELVIRIPLVRRLGRDLRTAVNYGRQRLRGEPYDLYFEPNSIPLPEILARRTVTMVFDLSVLLHPEWHPADRVRLFRGRFERGLKRTTHLLTATRYVKEQVMEHLGVPAERISVTPISCNKEVFHAREAPGGGDRLARLGVPRTYLAFVGSVEPRKNITGLLRAYLLLPRAVREEVSLVFCGPPGWKNQEVFELVERGGLRERIAWLPYLPDEEVCLLYQRALALVFPSFYEGFGLPPLEAMSAGCPVVLSDIPSHRELCGGAAEYVDPGSPDDIARGIRSVCEDGARRAELRARGLLRAEDFSWARTALQTLEVFREVAAGSAPPRDAASRSAAR